MLCFVDCIDKGLYRIISRRHALVAQPIETELLTVLATHPAFWHRTDLSS